MRKIGPHIEGGWSGSIGKPPVVKLVNVSPEYVREVRAAVGPDTLIVVRWIESQQPLDNPQVRAGQWMARHTSDMMAMADYGRDKNLAWESYNEVPDAQAVAYCAFERERVMSMHAVGLRSVVGNWSVGTPDLPTWASYRDALDAMHPQDLIGLHEYWSDNDDISNVWHCGRWQLVPELAGRPIVVTECGRDVVEGRGAAGWRKTCNAEQFLDDLREYDALLCQYPNVLGATVFTMGQYASQWAPFDVGQLWPQVVAEQEACVQEAHESATSSTPNPSNSMGLELPAVIMPIVNTAKAWYTADEWYGPYDGHPARARDWNLESGGNSDLGEPLQAPCDGTVVYAANAGGGHGIVVSFVAEVGGQLVNWHWKHLQRADVKQWQYVERGEPIGAIGNAGGRYAAHLHEEIIVGAIAGPTQDWRDEAYDYADPAYFYIAHGVPKAQVERMFRRDGR